MLGTPINFYGEHAPASLDVCSLPSPPLTSPFVCAQTCREFSVPVAKRSWTEPAQWAQWVLRMRRIPAASAASDLCGTIMSAGGGVSILRPYANSFQIRTKQNKTKAGTVGYGLLRSFLLAFCLFMRTFCAGRPFHILCELPARCFVYLHSHTHTHTQRTHSSHTTGIVFFPTYQRGLSWHKRIIKIPNYFF